jgi:hypothetical protein
MAKRSKSFVLPGMHGDVEVVVCSRRTIRKHAGQVAKDVVVNGLYIESEHRILVASELAPHARITTLMHELSHHTLDSTEALEEESRCDVIGGYLLKLLSDSSLLATIDEVSKA